MCEEQGEDTDALEKDEVKSCSSNEEALGAPPSDASSVISHFESDAETYAEEEGAADGGEGDPLGLEVPAADGDSDNDEPAGRKPAGTHTVAEHSNVYFTMTNNPGFQDVVLAMLRSWQTADEMGTAEFSKRLRPHHFGESKANPHRTYLVLRSWMLWRSARGGWNDKKAARQRWWRGEQDKLRRDIAALREPGGGTGSPKADSMIRVWMPSVF